MNLQALDIHSKQVAFIEGHINKLEEQLEDLYRDKTKLLKLALHEIYGVKEGDIVEANRYGDWGKAKVIDLCVSQGWTVDSQVNLKRKPWLTVARIKKDGTFSSKTTNAYDDWRVING